MKHPVHTMLSFNFYFRKRNVWFLQREEQPSVKEAIETLGS